MVNYFPAHIFLTLPVMINLPSWLLPTWKTQNSPLFSWEHPQDRIPFISVNGDDGSDDLAEGTYRITQSPNSGKQHDISLLE